MVINRRYCYWISTNTVTGSSGGSACTPSGATLAKIDDSYEFSGIQYLYNNFVNGSSLLVC